MTSRLKRKLNDLGVDMTSSKANENFCLVSVDPHRCTRFADSLNVDIISADWDTSSAAREVEGHRGVCPLVEAGGVWSVSYLGEDNPAQALLVVDRFGMKRGGEGYTEHSLVAFQLGTSTPSVRRKVCKRSPHRSRCTTSSSAYTSRMDTCYLRIIAKRSCEEQSGPTRRLHG